VETPGLSTLEPVSRLALLLGILLAALLAPGAVQSHPGGEPLVVVPVDHVLPGESFPLTGADLGPDAVVTFQLNQEDRVASLGRITAGPDGHLAGTFAVPASFPVGYTQLVASSSDGSEASVWILVGERTEATPPPPGGSGWGRERTLIVLALVVGLVAAALGLVAMRSGRRDGGSPHRSL
jgi:hypothetical protein